MLELYHYYKDGIVVELPDIRFEIYIPLYTGKVGLKIPCSSKPIFFFKPFLFKLKGKFEF